jgi:hypothetical protein
MMKKLVNVQDMEYIKLSGNLTSKRVYEIEVIANIGQECQMWTINGGNTAQGLNDRHVVALALDFATDDELDVYLTMCEGKNAADDDGYITMIVTNVMENT